MNATGTAGADGLLANVLRAGRKTGVNYNAKDTFEVVVLLYLKKRKRHDIHDVDNRLKDILDALQGQFGSSKTIRSKSRLIQNDSQVCRVVIGKQPIPKALSDRAGGNLLVRSYERHRWPLQKTKGNHNPRRRKKSLSR